MHAGGLAHTRLALIVARTFVYKVGTRGLDGWFDSLSRHISIFYPENKLIVIDKFAPLERSDPEKRAMLQTCM